MRSSLPEGLQKEVQSVIDAYPASAAVFEHIVEHYEGTRGTTDTSPAKRRKTSVSELPSSLEGCQIMLQLPDLSVQSPFRKKLILTIGAFKGQKPFLAFTKSMDRPPEIQLADLTAENITFFTILNVPEKKALRAMLIVYRSNVGHMYKEEPLLVQFNNDQLTEQFGPVLSGGTTLVSFLLGQIGQLGTPVFDGTGTDVFFVQAYNGTREGWLYFLPQYVIFGFRKPILIFSTDDIEYVTYTSITRHTFNASLSARRNGQSAYEKFEFSMIDQKDYERIDKFVQSQQFENKSMADELKAQKQLKSNHEQAGALTDAARLVPGGEKVVGNEDDENMDANYTMGDSEDDHSDDSGDDESDSGSEGSDSGGDGEASDGSDDSFDLEQELKDLQNDMENDSFALPEEGGI